jgi:hypothetical protein
MAGAGLRRLSDYLGLAKMTPTEFTARVEFPVMVISWLQGNAGDSMVTETASQAPTANVNRADALVVCFEPSARRPIWTLRIGRGVDADVMVPFETVSRTHAQLTRDASGRYTVMDIGSKNGTFVNGQEIPPHQATELKDGDRLRLGNVEGVFHGAASFHRYLRNGKEEHAAHRG